MLTRQYVLLFSVSLIRVIYDFVDQPPTVLRAMSRWFVFAQGVLDALIYGLVEWQYVTVPSTCSSFFNIIWDLVSPHVLIGDEGADGIVRNEWYGVEYERGPCHLAAQEAEAQVQETLVWLQHSVHSISEDQPVVSGLEVVPVAVAVQDRE